MICSCANVWTGAPIWNMDNRYANQIVFDVLNVTIPCETNKCYFRSDGVVDDIVAHTDTVITELGLDPNSIVYEGSGRKEHGRQMGINVGDGRYISIIWVERNKDKKLELACLQHEKYHALCSLNPKGVDELSARINELGYKLDLSQYEEELSATIVQVLSIYLLGDKFVTGSPKVREAVKIIHAAKTLP